MQLDSTATAHLQTLRDRSTGLAEFRVAAHALIPVLFRELQAALKQRGVAEETVVFAIVLRAALVFLPEAVRSFPSSPVAFAGLRRDEKTAIAHWYYENVPEITKKHTLVILDPMLATGGSAEESALNLLKRGADPQKIWFLGFLAAPEGINRSSDLISPLTRSLSPPWTKAWMIANSSCRASATSGTGILALPCKCSSESSESSAASESYKDSEESEVTEDSEATMVH